MSFLIPLKIGTFAHLTNVLEGTFLYSHRDESPEISPDVLDEGMDSMRTPSYLTLLLSTFFLSNLSLEQYAGTDVKMYYFGWLAPMFSTCVCVSCFPLLETRITVGGDEGKHGGCTGKD